MEPTSIPQDIGPARGINKIVGGCFLVIAAIPALPIFGAIYYDGFASILGWPSLFNWFAVFAAMFVSVGVYLLMTPQRVGVDVHFRPSGFDIHIRQFFRADKAYQLDWSNVMQIDVIKAPQNGDALIIRPGTGSVPSFQVRFVELGVDQTLARFHDSAKGAGYRLDREGGYNVLIFAKQIWRVSQNP